MTWRVKSLVHRYAEAALGRMACLLCTEVRGGNWRERFKYITTDTAGLETLRRAFIFHHPQTTGQP